MNEIIMTFTLSPNQYSLEVGLNHVEMTASGWIAIVWFKKVL